MSGGLTFKEPSLVNCENKKRRNCIAKVRPIYIIRKKGKIDSELQHLMKKSKV